MIIGKRNPTLTETTPVENLGDFISRVKPETVINLFFNTEDGLKRIPPVLLGNPTAEQLKNSRYLKSQIISSRKHYCTVDITSGWNVYIDSVFDPNQYELKA